MLLAVASLAMARDATLASISVDARPPAAGLDSTMAGLYRVQSKWTFLYLTGSLPGTLSNADFQWRTGVGAAYYWWLDASDADVFFFAKRGWASNWDASKPVGPYNHIGMVVSIHAFQEWFWCGVSLYDRYGRFLGYGCHTEYGPRPEGGGKLTAWMVQQIAESRPKIWTVLGAMCILKRSEHMEVQPPCPDSDDNIRVLLSGEFGNACPQLSPAVSIDGPNMHISGTITSSGEFCSSVVTPWTVEHEIGVLPAGTYTATATITDPVSGYWSFQDTLVFDVIKAGID